MGRWLIWGLLQLALSVAYSPRERCSKELIRGPCTNWQTKWYFNRTLRACRTFQYGGCGGENLFNDEIECLHYCIGGDHTLPPTEATSPRPRQRTRPGWRPHLSEADVELTFESGDSKVFTMAKSNAYIQLDGPRLKNFQLKLNREISFQFKTRLPHGLLVYHSIKSRPEHQPINPYALYIIVEKGQLKVVHVYGKHSTSVIVGEGLNRDAWHMVRVTIDLHGTRLIAKVDDRAAEVQIQGLHPRRNYDVQTDPDSVVLIGGLTPEEKLHGVKYIIESFVGCIQDVVLSAGKSPNDLQPLKPLIATKFDNIEEGCIDKCLTRENLCFEGSLCINHYNSLSCNCFGTKYEGEQCDIYTATILTFRGSSYVSYRVYDWKDRVHSSSNKISLHFKTHFDDSALFYASGEAPAHHHIAVSVINATIVVDADMGSGFAMAKLGEGVTDNLWHNLTLLHENHTLSCYLDDQLLLMRLPGDLRHLYIDPEIYIGGGPELYKRLGLKSFNNFVGSLKYVFFNDVSILYELNKKSPKVHYIGVLEPEFVEADVNVIPMTFAFPSSHFWWPNPDPTSLTIVFDYKSHRNLAALASGELLPHGSGFWQLRQVNDEVRFEVTMDVTKNVTHLLSVKYDSKNPWHNVELSYKMGEVILTVDQLQQRQMTFYMRISSKIIVGSSHISKGNGGLVGCMQKIHINGQLVEPRSIVRTERMVGTVSLDNCQLVDPCERPNACEHNGKCQVRDDRLECDCQDTGYIGKNCHFAKFRKTCEELALLGYTKPNVYLIDIDGNGRFPPAHVKCEFQSLEDATKTIVEHNLPSQVDVRSLKEQDFSFSITYREFTSEMLQELISHSLYCSQLIKYDCYKAPLELHSATWFVSAANNGTVDYLGNAKRGSCPCAENRTCVNRNLSCNCDIGVAKWHSDEGFYVSSNSLGITEMVFLMQKDLDDDAVGRITLGPLECVETNTQKYVVTFTTSQSYIEVPGWRKGDIAFSFRTTGEKAILLYQPPIRPRHPSFMVALTNDFLLTFNFTLNTGRSRELEIRSQRKLNGGEWQKIWIDYNEHHVRFMINTDNQMYDLEPEEEFGPFEGSMFIGGATEDLLENRSVRQGLIGCFRGLVVNGEILDIYSYMSVHLSEIIKDCKPSCDPNPCKNGARCKELWSSFECVCENPWAYIGTYCEININEDGMTLVTRESFLKRNFLSTSAGDPDLALFKGLLTSEILLLNLRTYDINSLILHANDHLNNFVQLYIEDGSDIVFLFNSNDTIINITVHYPELSNGKSAQIAVERKYGEIWLHVNDRNGSVEAIISLLTEYHQRPWSNPHNEVLAPPRPPAPPTEYFQLIIGGYDDSLLPVGNIQLEGYVGCIRGLKIGDSLANLTHYISAANQSDVEGLVAGCQMKCDEQPCKNQGVCIEDFLKGTSSCDCEYTSYYGEQCGQEKGAAFSGDSLLLRKFPLASEAPVTQVRVQLAFSTSDERQRNTVILLLQTENQRSYYLLVALSPEGDLIFEEDREGTAYGVRLKDRFFLNGARHSVYFKRKNDFAVLLVDREVVHLSQIQVLSLSEVPDAHAGANEVQIAGLNTTDPRFTAYSAYSGCLSNIFVAVNKHPMKPLDEYMDGSEDVIVKNSQGIRIAQCGLFDDTNRPRSGPSLNDSAAGVELVPWIEDPPLRIPYKSLYSDPSAKEEGTGRALFILALTVFCTVISGSLYHVYRTHVAYRKRKEEESTVVWRNGQLQYPEKPINIPPVKVIRSRSVCEGSPYLLNGRIYSYPDTVIRPAISLTRSKSQDDATMRQSSGNSEIKAYKSTPGTPAPTVRFRIPSSDQYPTRENGIVREKDGEEEVRVKLLKPNESKDALARTPSVDIISDTINEDSAGEREEEKEMERKTRLKSIDLGHLDKNEPEACSSRDSDLSVIPEDRRLLAVSRLQNLFLPLYLSYDPRVFSISLGNFGSNRFTLRRSSSTKSKESMISLD